MFSHGSRFLVGSLVVVTRLYPSLPLWDSPRLVPVGPSGPLNRGPLGLLVSHQSPQSSRLTYTGNTLVALESLSFQTRTPPYAQCLLTTPDSALTFHISTTQVCCDLLNLLFPSSLQPLIDLPLLPTYFDTTNEQTRDIKNKRTNKRHKKSHPLRSRTSVLLLFLSLPFPTSVSPPSPRLPRPRVTIVDSLFPCPTRSTLVVRSLGPPSRFPGCLPLQSFSLSRASCRNYNRHFSLHSDDVYSRPESSHFKTCQCLCIRLKSSWFGKERKGEGLRR